MHPPKTPCSASLGLLLFRSLLAAAPAWASTLSGGASGARRLGLAGRRHRERRYHEESELRLRAPPLLNFATPPPPLLSVANITPPTLPPPSVLLDPWRDVQPVDTALGAWIASGMVERPTVTPPPEQSSLDLVRAGCPLMTTWPLELEVDAFDPCDATHVGAWRAPGSETPLVAFEVSCSPFSGGLTPMVTYSTGSGELLAASQLLTTVVGSKVSVMDCAGQARYVIEERVYRQEGSVDADRCERYGSCDGTIWLQYFIHKAGGGLVAHTGYLKLFEESYDLFDPATGHSIATIARLGEWSPTTSECLGPRRYTVRYNPHPPAGPLANPTEQWPVAVLATVASIRDAARRPSGLLAPSWCEVSKSTAALSLLFLALALTCAGVLAFLRGALVPCKAFLWQMENRLCPKRMKLPSRYEGA